MSLFTRTVVQPRRAEELADSAPAAKVFEILYGLLADGPEWLRPEERARYATLFRDFARFSVRTHDREQYTETLPIRELPRAASQWRHALSIATDPLLLSFGLDALEFLFALLMGKNGYGETPDIEPIVRISPRLERGGFTDDRTLRKQYTERVLGRLPVLVRVPSDSSVRHKDDRVLVEAGESFGISLVRCHLSEDSPYEIDNLKVDWPRRHPLDRAIDFSFKSRLLVTDDPSGGSLPWTPGQKVTDEGPLLRVPAHWITGVLDLFEDPLGQRPSPVRTWTV